MKPLADAHVHLFPQGYPGRYGSLFPQGRELEVYEAIRASHHIRLALVVGYEGQAWARGNNAYLEKLGHSHSWIKPLAYASSVPLPSVTRLRRWMTRRFSGISLYVLDEVMRDCLLSASDEWAEVLNEKRAVISINCPPKIASQLRPLWERLTMTRILISHLGLPGPFASASNEIQPVVTLADLPHIGVKISALYAVNDYPHHGLNIILQQLVEAFSIRRLYWGSDFSPALDSVTFQQSIDGVTKQLNPNQALASIFHDNLNHVVERVAD